MSIPLKQSLHFLTFKTKRVDKYFFIWYYIEVRLRNNLQVLLISKGEKENENCCRNKRNNTRQRNN